MERFFREYQRIVEVGTAIAADLRPDRVCDAFSREAFRVFPPGGVDTLALYLQEDSERRYRVLVAWEDGKRNDHHAPVPFGDWPHADWARERNRNVFVADGALQKFNGNPEPPFGSARSLLIVVLRHRGRPIGGVLAQNRDTARAFSPFQYRLLQMMADPLAITLWNALALERLEATNPTDRLTGLPNERSFRESLSREMRRASRPQNVKSTSLLVVTVDDLERLSAERGAEAADDAFRAVARILRSRLRVEDVVARIDAGSFAILLPETDAAGARVVADKLLGAVDGAAALREGNPLPVAVSIGGATDPGEAVTFAENPTEEEKSRVASRFAARADILLRDAQGALPEARQRGPRRFHHATTALPEPGSDPVWNVG